MPPSALESFILKIYTSLHNPITSVRSSKHSIGWALKRDPDSADFPVLWAALRSTHTLKNHTLSIVNALMADVFFDQLNRANHYALFELGYLTEIESVSFFVLYVAENSAINQEQKQL